MKKPVSKNYLFSYYEKETFKLAGMKRLTFIPEDDLFHTTWKFFVYVGWRDRKDFQELEDNYNYDRYVSRNKSQEKRDEIDAHYAEIVARWKMKIGTYDELNKQLVIYKMFEGRPTAGIAVLEQAEKDV